MENKKIFNMYRDQKDLFDKLPDEKAGQLIKHIFSYVNDENPETDDLIIQIAFEPIKQQLKRDLEKRKDKCKKNSENGKLGGRPKKDLENPQKANGYFKNPKKPKKADTDKDTDTDTDKDIKEKTNKKVFISNKQDIIDIIDREYINYYGKGLKCLMMFVDMGYKIEKKEKEIKKFIDWLKEKAEIYGYILPEGGIYRSEMLARFDRWKEWHEEKKDNIKNFKSSVLVFLDNKGKQKK